MTDTTIRARQDIAPEFKWRLEDIYESAEAWEQDFAAAQKMIAEMPSLAQSLAATRESILHTLSGVYALDRLVEKLHAYAYMRRDEDSRETLSQAMADRINSLSVRAGAATAFLRPAMLTMPESLLLQCAQDEAFAEYDRVLASVLRNRPHTLPAEQEALLAQADEVGSAPSTIYEMLTAADLSFPQIMDADGKPTDVSNARLLPLLSSQDPRVRKDAYETVMNTYGKFGNTFASIYATSVKNDVFKAQAHHFRSAREGVLFHNEIPEAVYDNLLLAIEERLPALNRYLGLKQRAMGLDTLHLWDLYVDTTKDFDLTLSYEEGFDLVIEALGPLGEDYGDMLREARASRWVDVYENTGKHHGAYSWGCYDAHPYILMNFNGSLDSVSTLAHELGHAMHSYYSKEAQPYAKSHYRIFAAEVASTVNEILLSCYLLGKYEEPKAQQSLLGLLLEHFRTTVFRQSLFAAFERETHAMQERGEALTKEALCNLYYGINEKFYGAGSVVDETVRYEWMRIPHFYRAFYVYQYATGFSAAVCIARKILSDGQPAVDGYRKFLASGGSLPPIEALKLAGVDMETPQPVREALAWFEELLSQFEAVC